MPLRFGTDGIRGVANLELTPEFALALGRAAARRLEGGPFLVGRDTRLSGSMLQSALAAGIAAEGRDVLELGVIPTPGLAWLAGDRGLPAAMISASHNPFQDNGIKLFAAGGTKLSIEQEGAIESDLAGGPAPAGARTGSDVGRVTADRDSLSDYVAHLTAVVAGAPLLSGHVVVDCANGAASDVAPQVLTELGLDFELLAAEPDGRNINDGCGSTDLAPLIARVDATGAGLGVAFDGDADRMLAVDHTGRVVDGDFLIAMFASDLRRRGGLTGETVVVTVLSNLGLRHALARLGVSVVETPVGDRHVADALEAGGYVLGGEQSGHLIFRQHASTGDGMLTALLLFELLGRTGRNLAEIADEAMERLPQVMLNVKVPDPGHLEQAAAVWSEARAVEDDLGESGRVVLRRSGTESCVRVMVEAPTAEEAESYARRVAEVVKRELG